MQRLLRRDNDIQAGRCHLVNNSIFQHCLNAAYHYLHYRPRSEAEIKQRLHQRGFDTEAIEKTIARLEEQNLVNDYAFAQFWKDNRLSFRPKSKRLIAKELSDKKVAREIIEQITGDIDDMDNACKLGRRRMHLLTHLDYPDFHRRLSNYLGYRGFSYEVVRRTVALLWQEKEQNLIQH